MAMSSTASGEDRGAGGAGRAFALLTATVSVAIAVFFSLYSLLPVTRSESPELGSLFVGALMACVMGVQVFAPLLVRRFSLRYVLMGSLLLLGAGALVTGLATGAASLLLGALLSGSGFGVLVVVGTHGVALLVPQSGLGRALGVYGLVTMSASAFGSPLGVQIALVRSPAVFGICAVVACAGAAVLAIGLPAAAGRTGGSPGVDRAGRSIAGGASGGLRSLLAGVPWLVLCLLLVGVLVLSHGLTSLPVLASSFGSAAAVIFCVQLGCAAGRGIGGELGRWIPPGGEWAVAAAPAGIGGVLGMLLPEFAAGLLWALLLGVGAGAVQTVTLHAVLRRVEAGRASVVWNLAVDGGLWAGGVLWGLALAYGFVGGAVVGASVAVLALAAVLAFGAARGSSR